MIEVAVVVYNKKFTAHIMRALNILDVNYHMLLPGDIPLFTPSHIILTGSLKYVKQSYSIPQWIMDSNTPVLGICFGMQLIAETLGGFILNLPEQEHGPCNITEINNGIQRTCSRWMRRSIKVISLPKSFTITGVTDDNNIASYTDHVKWWGVQYHPEAHKHGDLNIFRQFFEVEPTASVCSPSSSICKKKSLFPYHVTT